MANATESPQGTRAGATRPLVRAAAFACAALAVVVATTITASSGVTAVLSGAAATLAALAGAWGLWARDSYLTRFYVTLVLVAMALVGVLALSVGLPGGSGPSWRLSNCALVAFPALIGLLLARDASVVSRRRS